MESKKQRVITTLKDLIQELDFQDLQFFKIRARDELAEEIKPKLKELITDENRDFLEDMMEYLSCHGGYLSYLALDKKIQDVELREKIKEIVRPMKFKEQFEEEQKEKKKEKEFILSKLQPMKEEEQVPEVQQYLDCLIQHLEHPENTNLEKIDDIYEPNEEILTKIRKAIRPYDFRQVFWDEAYCEDDDDEEEEEEYQESKEKQLIQELNEIGEEKCLKYWYEMQERIAHSEELDKESLQLKDTFKVGDHVKYDDDSYGIIHRIIENDPYAEIQHVKLNSQKQPLWDQTIQGFTHKRYQCLQLMK